MHRYIFRRILQAVPLMLGITLVVFVLIQASGDPLAMYENDPRMTAADRQRLAERFGLDRPLHEQYVTWLGRVLQADLGFSFATGQPVTTMILDRLPNSLILMGVAFALALGIAIPLGVYSAVRQYSVTDYVVTGVTFVAYATPAFWLGLLMIMLFSMKFREWGLPYLPPGGMYDLREGRSLVGLAQHVAMPAIVLAVVYAAPYLRYLRGSVLEVLNHDYVRTARAKGMTERTVLYRHALKNAALPVVTVVLMQIPYLLAGAMIVEQVFAWPGMGRLFWEHATRVDYPVIMGILLLVSAMVVIMNIVADVAYVWLDPRIRFQ